MHRQVRVRHRLEYYSEQFLPTREICKSNAFALAGIALTLLRTAFCQCCLRH